MWRKWRQPLCAGNCWEFSRLAAIEQDLAALIPPDEMRTTLHVSDSTPPVRVQRNNVSWRDGGEEHAHAVVLQQKLVMLWCGDERVQ